MFQFVPKTETRFWGLFRCLVVPIGMVTFIASLVFGIAAACGESAVFYGGRPVTGFTGFMLSFGYWPVVTVVVCVVAATVLYVDRNFKIWRRR